MGSRTKVAIAVLLGVASFAASSPKPAAACTNCGGIFWEQNKQTYSYVSLNGTVMDIGTYNKFILVSVQNRGEPTWTGTLCSDATYNGNWTYGPFDTLTQTLYVIHEGWCYTWGPGDHVQATPTHIEYMTGGGCCYLTAGPHETSSYWYHLPDRNVDSGYKINLHFHVNQCISFLPALPCGGSDVFLWTELHGNGTQAWDGHGSGVANLHLGFLP